MSRGLIGVSNAINAGMAGYMVGQDIGRKRQIEDQRLAREEEQFGWQRENVEAQRGERARMSRMRGIMDDPSLSIEEKVARLTNEGFAEEALSLQAKGLSVAGAKQQIKAGEEELAQRARVNSFRDMITTGDFAPQRVASVFGGKVSALAPQADKNGRQVLYRGMPVYKMQAEDGSTRNVNLMELAVMTGDNHTLDAAKALMNDYRMERAQSISASQGSRLAKLEGWQKAIQMAYNQQDRIGKQMFGGEMEAVQKQIQDAESSRAELVKRNANTKDVDAKLGALQDRLKDLTGRYAMVANGFEPKLKGNGETMKFGFKPGHPLAELNGKEIWETEMVAVDPATGRRYNLNATNTGLVWLDDEWVPLEALLRRKGLQLEPHLGVRRQSVLEASAPSLVNGGSFSSVRGLTQ